MDDGGDQDFLFQHSHHLDTSINFNELCFRDSLTSFSSSISS